MIKKRWTQEEEDLLIKLKESEYTYKEISKILGRSAKSCINKYKRLTDPKYVEKEKEYRKEYYKRYYENNKDQILEYQKKYKKQYYQNNRDKKLEYQKKYNEDNKDKIAEYQKKYQRNYHAQNPHKTIRKERYDGEFADIKLCHDFYNHVCPITGMKDDLQVHHLINIKDNQKFWQSAIDEEKIENLILIHKDLHMAYHSWLGGTKVESSPESFWEFIDNIWFNEK